jgi:hypothetical protein
MARSMMRRESSAALALAALGVEDVQITYDADRGFPGPSEKALGVSLDEADRTLGHVDVVLQEILPGLLRTSSNESFDT